MSQIDVSIETLQRWYDAGVAKGAVAMTIMTDTFPHTPEQGPEYEIPGVDKEPRGAMHLVGRTFSLLIPLAEQMPSDRQICFCIGPCGCP